MNPYPSLLKLSPQAFVEFLIAENICRFYFVYDRQEQTVKSSHPQLQSLADFMMSDQRDFLQHEGLFFQVTKKYYTLQGAFIHRTCRGQAAGGVRYWTYATVEDYLRDGLRLAKGMTRKNALAGLWWGGGKGVMARNPAVDQKDENIRASIYREYGELLSSLRGCYITAEDVGTYVKDMAEVFKKTRFTICIPEELGGSGNPSIPTARGVVKAMEAALTFLNSSDLQGKTIAIQGVGNVGGPLIGFLLEKNVRKILACDINENHAEKVKKEYRGKNLEVHTVPRDDASILAAECDILSPNATGAILNPQTIPKIKAKIVCGAANNQLEDAARDDRLLLEQGIIYVPDFLANRMGIVYAANEQYGYVNPDPVIEKHLSHDWEHSLFQTTLRVLKASQKTGESTGQIAVSLADKLSQELHPIFGHRGQQIIDSLVADDWQTILSKGE